MAYRVLESLESIVDKELGNINAYKIRMPSLLSSELWKQTGRWEKTGVELFRLHDRKGTDFCLSPTHEEEITQLVKNEVKSYRDLPVRLYQISWKYRDEARPRYGLMRCREFLMKDLYTFDKNYEEALQTYDLVCHVYERLFQRLSLKAIRSEADAGNIGGQMSHEFHVLTNVGEDTVHFCSCGYATNHEKCGDIHCPKCRSELRIAKAIELGHAFLLGDIYSKPLRGIFMDHQGHMNPYYMGCYGLGMTRLLASLVEIHSDEHGIRWPDLVAPYSICIVYPSENPELSAAAIHAYDTLDMLPSLRNRVLLDDRDHSVGYKLNDARFMGYPYTLVIGKNYQESGKFESLHRWTGTRDLFDPSSLSSFFTERLVDDHSR